MAKRRYAQDTSVPVSRSLDHIRDTVEKYDGQQYGFGMDDGQVCIWFTRDDRQVRFHIPVEDKEPQEQRAAMRSLLLVIKAKLEAVESGIAIFEDEFLANIVLHDGSLVGNHVRDKIALSYQTGEPPNLLPDYTS